MPINIFILGSCVSRDSFNYDDNHQFEIANYIARTSLASCFVPSILNGIQLDQISSLFQRRVEKDIKAILPRTLRNTTYDILLLDVIDERFDLYIDNSDGVCTLSNEFYTTGFDPDNSDGYIVPSGSKRFLKKWLSGWYKLIAILKAQGNLDRLRVNEVYWSNKCKDGRDYLPTYSAEKIKQANALLSTLYSHMRVVLPESQFLRFDDSYFVGANEHKWGRSPFHFEPDYYREVLNKLRDSLPPIKGSYETAITQLSNNKIEETTNCSSNFCESTLPDRKVDNFLYFGVNPQSDAEYPLILESAVTNGSLKVIENHIAVLFQGQEDSYQYRFKLAQQFLATGVGVRFRLRNWKSLRYVAIGYTHEGTFRHVKLPNVAVESWVNFSIGHHDLAFGLQNNWENPPATTIEDVRLYLKGTPGDGGAWLDIENLWCWEEAASPPQWLTQYKPTANAQVSGLLDITYDYLKKCFRNADSQATKFMSQDVCQLYGETSLDWPTGSVLPTDLDKVGTYQFSWHALHPAMILMIYSRKTGEVSPLFAAREFITNWLDRSYYQPDLNIKYAWYDHGTAERLLTMIMMWSIGIEQAFDHRFMIRLRTAIFRHAQLLNSELFYASHQPTRYHNHAWFQDLALMATALAMQDFPCANQWLETSLWRLSDQLETLIVRDNGYAVFIENSIGYHQGVQRLVEFAGDLATITGKDSVIPTVAKELSHFSDFLRYPDNRAPAQGDTFRRHNNSGKSIRCLKPYPEPSVTLLSKAGYAIVKGNHLNTRFMLTMFATSLCRTHKHEDNLSFTLFFDGLEWLIDPSFYSHEYKAPIPAYLRSASAHNALVLPGKDYSIDPGKSHLDGTVKDNNFILRGHHDAYDDIRIERKIRGKIDTLNFKVVDIGSGEIDNCELRLMLHCGEGVKATLDRKRLNLSHPDSKYILSISFPNVEAKIFYGQSEGSIIRGVSGLGFMEISDINTIEYKVPINGKIKWSVKALEA